MLLFIELDPIDSRIGRGILIIKAPGRHNVYNNFRVFSGIGLTCYLAPLDEIADLGYLAAIYVAVYKFDNARAMSSLVEHVQCRQARGLQIEVH